MPQLLPYHIVYLTDWSDDNYEAAFRRCLFSFEAEGWTFMSGGTEASLPTGEGKGNEGWKGFFLLLAFDGFCRTNSRWTTTLTSTARSSLVEGDEGSRLSNIEIHLVNARRELSLLFWYFINTTAYHLGRFEPLPSSAKGLYISVRLVKWHHWVECLFTAFDTKFNACKGPT